MDTIRRKQATEWIPKNYIELPRPVEMTCYSLHHKHVGHIPNYAGHIPGVVKLLEMIP
ncbi:hypothetical protein Phum_PHUM210700 [Pediculus humanus corporis]|uniref:Uncharacterized protein n=1 Tax=Pediculus humanus subsp. corporis TaxID=121224 RepID=E0VHS0_PEDHC|nr:uncharacterized protein Phum_PHUM210700 [Pediculus humanus corporis]EEB12843.1 hypothetical protein Phum_PHUM210700 [Pediculus humanus corporis]